MHIQRMQKELAEMNVQRATVLSDLSGLTGMKIVRAIVAGERDGKCRAEFRDPNVKASKETIAQSLEGTWRREQLAVLGRALAPFYIPTKVAKVSNSLLGDPLHRGSMQETAFGATATARARPYFDVGYCEQQALGKPNLHVLMEVFGHHQIHAGTPAARIHGPTFVRRYIDMRKAAQRRDTADGPGCEIEITQFRYGRTGGKVDTPLSNRKAAPSY